MPSTLINDAPISIDPALTGAGVGAEDYDGKFEGPMWLAGLANPRTSCRSASCRRSDPPTRADWVTLFGFEADKHPAYLKMALGAAPWQPGRC